MIITRTPLRISFAGGGSDLKEYYKAYGGSVLSTTINKYIYLSGHEMFNSNEILLKYSELERINDINKIKHNIIREVFNKYKINNIDLNSSADLPTGTGLGSSSAFTSGLILLCNAYKNKTINKLDLAKQACEIEIDILKEPIGKQDQYSTTYGGMNFITFNQDGTVEMEKIELSNKNKTLLNERLMLFYLGRTRTARSILTEQKNNYIKEKVGMKNIHEIVKISRELKKELKSNSLNNFGEMLNQGWRLKKELASKISNPEIDYYYDLAIKNGAIGGKLLGAGGSGFLLFYCLKENQNKLIESLNKILHVDFNFENKGSSIIYNQ